ncbi:MAG TPA: hypothetical protein VJY35_13200 [Candidatus Eisenbacteria bacterium]|nr:hypothetical protein [Candidatus Eisenbacteria bacterium]
MAKGRPEKKRKPLNVRENVALLTGHVGIGGVAQAFDELGSPERHAKILVHPER